MIYLDSNVFIYALLDEGKKGETARKLLKNLQGSDERSATSVITIDEVFYVIKKKVGLFIALDFCKGILEFPNLRVVEVDKDLLWTVLEIIKIYDLDPRDGIHMACALKVNAEKMLSDDRDFDKIKEIRRVGL